MDDYLALGEYDPFENLPGDPPLDDYDVCNALLNAETNEHCEWDGQVDPSMLRGPGHWVCPACGRLRALTQEAGS